MDENKEIKDKNEQHKHEEKTYLTWVNKIGYGSGDIAGNVVYALLSAFVMIFLTDTVGMNAGVVGTLIAVSKLFDGVSDIFFGSLIDKTNTKMGKARPWMLYGYFGCAICLVAIFCIPADLSATAQYAWFFIAYTLLNAGFYTANNIAYSALTALITKNNHERVQMGSIRFMFAFGTSMLIQTITVALVAYFGGGAAAWRTVAIIYAIVGVISNTLSVMSVKELTPEELAEGEEVTHEELPEGEEVAIKEFAEGEEIIAAAEEEEKYTLIDAFKLLIRHTEHGHLLHDLRSQKRKPPGSFLLVHQHSDDHRSFVHTGAGHEVRRHVQAQPHGLHHRHTGPSRRRHSRLSGLRAAHVGLYGYRCSRYESAAGRHERPDRHLLRVHLPDPRQARRRHHVFLHFPRHQAGRRHRYSPRRLAPRL